jgi:hypothetical protein
MNITPPDFASTYAPYADAVSHGTGIDAGVLLAQWGVETAWGNAINNLNNLGNIRCSPTTFCQYATLDDFVLACIATWHNGFYGAVLAATGAPPADQIAAIGQSPWSGQHYGSPPGQHIQDAYKEIPDVTDPIVIEKLDAILEAVQGGYAVVTATGANVDTPLWASLKQQLQGILDAVKAVQVNPIVSTLSATQQQQLQAAADAAEAALAGVQRIELALKAA